MLEVWPTLDYRPRPLLKVGVYSLQERSSGLHVQILPQSNFIRGIPKLRVLFQDQVDLLSETRILVPQLILYCRLWCFGLRRHASNFVSGR